jgi:hypothetical protein
MQQPAELEIPNVVSYLPEFGHLLCKPCRSVMPYRTLYFYLCYYHKIRASFCKAIISQYEGFPVSQTDADVVPLAGRSSVLEFLASPTQGHFCLHCDYTTASWGMLLMHFWKTQCSRERKTRDDTSCFLQQWTSIRRNCGGSWRVEKTTPTAQRRIKNRSDWDKSALDDPATVTLL